MHEIVKVPENNKTILESIYRRLIGNCYKHAFIEKEIFLQCCNSIYTITNVEDRSLFLGLIACRRIQSADICDQNLIKYHPQKYHFIYRIEALHYDKSVPLEKRAELIETCLKDKNDSFIILECKCQNVCSDIELFRSLGFNKGYSNDKRTVLVRAPKSARKVILKRLKL